MITTSTNVGTRKEGHHPLPFPLNDNGSPGKSGSCNFCGRHNHKTFQCRTVYGASERRKVAVYLNLCWKCFIKEHHSSECPRPNCRICGKLHDQALCLQKPSTATQPSKPNGKKLKLRTQQSRVKSNMSNSAEQQNSDAKSPPNTIERNIPFHTQVRFPTLPVVPLVSYSK